MARAVARIDLGAVERNCARLKAELGEGAELCAVVKADGYGHGADACASAALAGGATRLAVATGARGRADRPPPPARSPADDGGAHPDELDAALAAGSEVAVWREGFRDLLGARARAQGRPARVHVKHDSGMGRLGNPDPEEVLALARACAEDPISSWPGSGPTSPPPTNPTRPSSTSSSSASRRSPRAVKAEFPGVDRPCRQQRRGLPRAAAPTSTWPAAASPSTASIPSRATRPSAACAGALAALLRRRRQALRGRRQRRLRADLAGAEPTPGSACCRSATATACGAASPTTPRSWSAAAATRWSAPSRWTT